MRTVDQIADLVEARVTETKRGRHADEIWLNPPVSTAVAERARGELGRTVPIADDDEEYYAKCSEVERSVHIRISVRTNFGRNK